MYYKSDSLKRDGFPPVAVSAQVFNYDPNKKNFIWTWEFRCQSKEIQVGTAPIIPIAADGGTTRRILLEGLCGVRNDSGLWFTVGRGQSGLFAINAESLKSTSANEFSVITSQVAFDATKTPFIATVGQSSEMFFSCADRTKSQYRSIGQVLESPNTDVQPASPAAAVIHTVCSGFFPVATRQLGTQSDAFPSKGNSQSLADSIENAKKTCIDLGFELKSERFADCVLKVSR